MKKNKKKSTRCRVQITKTTKIGKKIVVLICLLILFCLLLRRWSFSSLFAHAFFFVRVCILSAALMNSSRFFLISSILFIAFVAAKLKLFFSYAHTQLRLFLISCSLPRCFILDCFQKFFSLHLQYLFLRIKFSLSIRLRS